MRRLILVGLLAAAVALTGTAYAEVQNIKVSGDIDLKGVIHNNYDLKTAQDNIASGNPGANAADSDNDDANFLLSTVHLNVAADLTDNVSTSVRLVNQRMWGDATTSAIDDINIDHAYVTLKQFLYSPLTVIAGRQPLKYGTGFIVGDGQLADPNGVFTGVATGSQAQIGQEYSAYNAFDAVRLILDFAPVTVDGVLAKVAETGTTTDDTDLYGLVVNYKLDRWSAEVEPYWFYKNDEAASISTNDSLTATQAVRTYESNKVHTVGLRTAASPIENLKLSGEGAFQFGDLADTTAGPAGQLHRDRRAWAATVYANYTWAKMPWTPSTGAGWVFYSGEQASAEQGKVGETGIPLNDQKDTFNAWDPVYRGAFQTYIQDFLTGRDAQAGLYTTFDRNDTAATTNRHLIYGDASLNPMKDVTLWARYTHARFDRAPRLGRSHHAGDEVDVKALYDYTEDVQLTLFGGWFFPGHYYDEPGSNDRGNQLAWTTGGAASVKF